MLIIRLTFFIVGITLLVGISDSSTIWIGLGKLIFGAIFIFMGGFGVKSDN